MRRSVGLSQIKTWTQYVDSNLKSPIHSQTPEFPIDDKINSKISLWQGDITHLQVDAIVNAAKKTLMGGAGVDGAIHAAAGPQLKEACKKVAPCSPGSAKLTGGFNLPAKFVIHTVGPTDQSERVLISAYQSSLDIANENNFATVAFPCIGTGIYGFPDVKAAHIASRTAREYMNLHKNQMKRIIFAVFDKKQKEIYENVLPIYFPTKLPTSSTQVTPKTSVKSAKSLVSPRIPRIVSAQPKTSEQPRISKQPRTLKQPGTSSDQSRILAIPRPNINSSSGLSGIIPTNAGNVQITVTKCITRNSRCHKPLEIIIRTLNIR